MLASQVRVQSFQTSSDCWKAVELIESDSRNVVGGAKAWNSGKQIYFTEAAKSKIAALEARANKPSPNEED